MAYTLKNVRTAGGDETIRFEAHLCLDGAVIAHVSNGGHGGCNEYRWSDRAHADPFEAFALAWQKKTHPSLGDFEPGDNWIGEEMMKADAEARFAKRIKGCMKRGQTPFTLKGDPEGSYRAYKAPYGPVPIAYIQKKYGAKVAVIFDPKDYGLRPPAPPAPAVPSREFAAAFADLLHKASPHLGASDYTHFREVLDRMEGNKRAA